MTIFDSNGEELSAELEKDDEGVVKVWAILFPAYSLYMPKSNKFRDLIRCHLKNMYYICVRNSFLHYLSVKVRYLKSTKITVLLWVVTDNIIIILFIDVNYDSPF